MPRVADAEERRSEVVEAAFRLLARDGVEAFSMRAVAKEAGCTIGLINHWFSSKDELVDAALGEAIASAKTRAEIGFRESSANPENALAEFLPLDDVRSQELRVWLAFWALGVSRPHLQELHKNRYSSLRDELIAIARSMGVPSKHIDQYADVVMPLLDGITVNALVNPTYWTPVRQMRSLKSVLQALERQFQVSE